MILNYQLQQHPESVLTPMVFIHGLFGSLSNLGMLARHYAEQRTVIQIDVRNHGLSEHQNEVTYQAMANDVLETLNSAGIEKYIVVGHSMGGKIAMTLASIASSAVEKLIVLDISPVCYLESHHDKIFKALFAVQESQPSSRIEAGKMMREFINEEMVIQFLLKSFNKGQWLFNVKSLFDNYNKIMDWTNIAPFKQPSLFLRGGLSFYISKPDHFEAIEKQFADSKVVLIEGAGHWLHGEKTTEVLAQIDAFLE